MNNLSINAFEISGDKLKQVIFMPHGVLIHDNEWITFIPSPMVKAMIHKLTNYEGKRKVVFASLEFDKIQKLSDNEQYIVWIAKDVMNIHRAETYEYIMSIYGTTF